MGEVELGMGLFGTVLELGYGGMEGGYCGLEGCDCLGELVVFGLEGGGLELEALYLVLVRGLLLGPLL